MQKRQNVLQSKCPCLLYTKKMTKYDKIRNDPSNSKSGEKKKKKKKTELSEQSITSDGISFCHRCVHITKASINAAVCALWQTENFITASHQKRNIFQPRLQGEVNSKKSAQIRCALRHKLHFSPFYFYVYAHISLCAY